MNRIILPSLDIDFVCIGSGIKLAIKNLGGPSKHLDDYKKYVRIDFGSSLKIGELS